MSKICIKEEEVVAYMATTWKQFASETRNGVRVSFLFNASGEYKVITQVVALGSWSPIENEAYNGWDLKTAIDIFNTL